MGENKSLNNYFDGLLAKHQIEGIVMMLICWTVISCMAGEKLTFSIKDIHREDGPLCTAL